MRLVVVLTLFCVEASLGHGIPRVFAPEVAAVPDTAEDRIRILLFDLTAPTAIAVSARGGPVHVYAADEENALATLQPGTDAVIRRASNQLHVTIGALALYATSIRIEPSNGALFGVRVSEGGQTSKQRHYGGRLSVTVDEDEWELKLVNEIRLEEYVAAVIATEYGFDDLEGAKAMAVIIRTYALAALGKFGSDYDHVDHTLSQVYSGSDDVTPTMRRAVEETRGQVLTYQDELIEAVYFSSSGGHTVDNEAVWDSNPKPYLRGKPDPYGRKSPHYKWSSGVSRSKLLAALSAAYGVAVTGFVVAERTIDGRASKIDLLLQDGGRRSIGGNDFRMAMIKHFGATTLKSTLFDVRRDGEEYVFEGSGYGHGVGLSQWGAHDLAESGASYTEILDFYYTGVELATLEALDARRQRPEPIATKKAEEPSSRIGW